MTDHGGHDHDHDPAVAVDVRRSDDRAAVVRRARWLNVATIGWNSVEGVVAVLAGVAADSVSLIGFGFDSAIEVSAAVVLAWRLRQERREECMQDSDRRATRAIAISFVALALYVGLRRSAISSMVRDRMRARSASSSLRCR